ncbi:MAG: cell wall hydrolase [Rhodobacteraceae bacterium]|nr:cell wall hydrolase [Paracoccaceae bacterium]
MRPWGDWGRGLALAVLLTSVAAAEPQATPASAGGGPAGDAAATRRAAPAESLPRFARRLDGATDILRYDRDWLAALPAVEGDEEWRCLARAIYHEARGETVEGQFAVAEVILNRVDAPDFPDTICAVVFQGSSRARACQFSFACDGRPDTMHNPRARDIARKIARLMIDGAPRRLTQGATHFHNRRVRPRWARVFDFTVEIGAHVFYRMPTRLASN